MALGCQGDLLLSKGRVVLYVFFIAFTRLLGHFLLLKSRVRFYVYDAMGQYINVSMHRLSRILTGIYCFIVCIIEEVNLPVYLSVSYAHKYTHPFDPLKTLNDLIAISL